MQEERVAPEGDEVVAIGIDALDGRILFEPGTGEVVT